ncbi:MAG: hypothetical protein RIS41_2328 [Actinomycetota bacterium]|jgi:hypothetical protein
MASTLMEHLPPSGWGDVVRVDQMAEVERRLNIRIDMLEHRMEAFDSRLKLVITGGLVFALAMIAMQVQIMISIANL